jgi:hypothetical protein
MLMVLVTLPVLSGCGKSSPTAPVVEPGPEPEPELRLRTTVTVTRILAVKDCDGAEGAGEFQFAAIVHTRSKVWFTQLSTGDSKTVNWENVFSNQSGTFEVEFQATEGDVDVFGNEFADPDMSWNTADRSHTFSVSTNGDYSITLGNDRCKVRRYYTIESEMVPR